MQGAVIEKEDNFNEMALEYKTFVHKIKNMINGIRELGFDISRYENILLEIIRKTEASSDVQSNPDYENRNGLVDYSKVLNDLKRLDLELSEKYGIYYEVNKTCEYIKQVLKNKINNNQLIYISNLIIKMLNKIIRANLQLNDHEEKLIKDIYKVAYNIIKLEFIVFGSSNVYKYAYGSNALDKKTSQIHLYFFDMCVLDEIKKLDLTDMKYNKVRELVFDVERMGLGTSYLDKNLIIELISHTGIGVEYFDKTIAEIYGLCDKICENNNKIDNDIDLLVDSKQSYLDSKKKYKLSKKGLGKNITILSLTSSIILGSYIGVITLAANITKNYVFKKESKVYSELTDSYSEPTSEEYLCAYDSKENEVLVKVYGSWDISGEEPIRKISTYDLSNITIDSIYELLECELSSEYLIDTESVSSDYYFDKDKYEEDFREIIFNEYTYQNDTKIHIGGTIFLSFLFSLAYFLVFILIGGFLEDVFDWSLIVEQIDNIKDILNRMKEPKEDMNEIFTELKEIIRNILDKISENEELKNEFSKKMMEYGHLLSLNERSKLINMVGDMMKLNKVNAGKIKKLAKKYNIK